MTQAEVWTVGRLLTWTTEYLKKQGSHNSRLDAEVLLAHARHCKRIELYTAFETVPTDEEKSAFREMVRRRAEGTPVAYLVGSKEFYSLQFYVNQDCLIPRPETEHLVLTALDLAKNRSATAKTNLQVADICTGSGCIAVAFAKQFAKADIVALELDSAAMQVAQRNIELHQLGERIELLQSDLLDAVSDDLRFDLILSNPPYVSQSEYDTLPKSVRNFEPKIALLAEKNGTAIIERLMLQASDKLLPGGSLLIELSPMIAAACKNMFEQTATWNDVRLVKDLAGHQRVIVASKK